MYLVAIGGLRIRNAFHAPEFYWRASHTLAQARGADGCLHASVFRKAEGLFSLTVWQSPAEMKRYAHSGAHARILKVAPRLAVIYHFHHYRCDGVPDAQDAYDRWKSVR